MSTPSQHHQEPPVDLSKCRNVPNLMIGIGGAIALIGLFVDLGRGDGGRLFGYAWLTGYMFCFSLMVGSLFLVIVHHLFDAGWSVPTRRICENISSLMPWMLVFFIPVGILAPKMYSWMSHNPAEDHELAAKAPLFTMPGFYISTIVIIGLLSFIALGLRKWSVAQDKTGAAECTHKMRKYSYFGIFLFAFLVTLGAIMWMKGLQHQWFSTMYGVQYFAGSVWTTLAVVYVITMTLSNLNVIRAVLHKHQFYYLGSLFFAFTVFYAYVTFAQYFIIWNANMPEETFWFLQREGGGWLGWKGFSMIIIFGHFFLPFLVLLRIDNKENFKVMTFFAVWALLMRFVDMVFNIMPVPSPDHIPFKLIILALACAACILGFLIKLFLAKHASAAPYPLKDPRLAEAMGIYTSVPTPISGGEVEDVDDYEDSNLPEGERRPHGGKS